MSEVKCDGCTGPSCGDECDGKSNATTKTVNMVIIENADFSISWECSGCKKEFKATSRLEKSKECPNCKTSIVRWVGMDDYEEE